MKTSLVTRRSSLVTRPSSLITAAAALCLSCALSAAEKPYRVAVLPSWKNWGHVHDYDFAYKAAGYEYTNCVETAEQFEWLDKHLDEFNLVLAPPLFHYQKDKAADPGYTRPYSMAKIAPRLAKWIQDGGCLFVVDANYAVGLEWFKLLDPAMELTACVDPRDMKTELKCNGFGPAAAKEPLDSLLFFPQTAEYGFGWGHMQIPDESKSAWDVLARCGHGCPTLVARRWGRGIVLVNSLRSYVPQFLENIRVNQQFLSLGITVTDSHMPDPIPGTNLFSFACANSSDKPLAGELRLSLAKLEQGEDGKWAPTKAQPAVYSQRGSVPAGTNGTFVLSCRIKERGRYRATMTFSVGSLSATCFERDITLPELFAVTSSRFRGVVPQKRRFDAVSIGTSFYPVGGDVGKHKVRLSFRDAFGRTLSTTEAPVSLYRGWVSMPLSRGIQPGKYTLRGELVVEGGAAPVASSETPLEIVGDGPGFAIADEDNALISNGEPFLPLGIYHPGAPKECGGYNGEFARIADLGFNTINIFSWAGVRNLDRLHELDVRAFWEQLPHRSPGASLAIGMHTVNHPAALINYTMDEPSEAQFAFVHSLNDAWHESDPYHPTVVVSYQPHHFTRNAYMSDILAPDCYPWSEVKGDDSEIDKIWKWTERAKAASGGMRPVIFVPQAFGGEPPHIWRNMPLQALIHGAKGIVWYAWNEGPQGVGLRWHEPLLAEVERFLPQLRALAPAILGAGKDAPRSFGGEDDAIHGMVCHVPGAATKILILVNVTKEKAEADIVLPELAPGATSIAGAYGDAPLATTSNGVHAVLGSYGSGIWCWDGEAPVPGRLAREFAVRKLPARRSGRTLKVAADGAGGVYTNLQQAVDAAKDGDTILVGEGTWGPIVADNVLVDIVATGARDKTVIDAAGRRRAATLTQKPWGDMSFQTNTLVQGFTIRGGKASLDAFRPDIGGGVLGGTLVDCVVTANEAANGGGVAYANVFDSQLFRNVALQTGGGASRCRIARCAVRENRSNWDGGGLSYCRVTSTELRGNTAGRNGGGANAGTLDACRVIGNTCERNGGGTIFAEARNTLYKRNNARNGEGGGVWGGRADFCTFAENTAREGGAIAVSPHGGWGAFGVSTYASVFTSNRASADQATANFLRVGTANKCFVDSTNMVPRGATFAKLAFLDPGADDYRPVTASPLIDCASDTFIPRNETDCLGAPRLAGGFADAGAFELPALPRVALDVDFGCGRNLIGRDRSLFPLYPQTESIPSVKDGALVCDGTQRIAPHGDVRALNLGYPVAPVATFACVFRADAGGGTVFALLNAPENGLWAEVDKASGKLRVVLTYGNPKDENRAVFETAGKVTDKSFHTLVVSLDRNGGLVDGLKVTLDGKDVPCAQQIKGDFPAHDPKNYLWFPNRFFQIAGRQDGPSFHGAIKSVKVVCDAAR